MVVKDRGVLGPLPTPPRGKMFKIKKLFLMFQIKTMTTKWPQLSVGAERGKKASPFLYWKK